ncbi:hypothetical protein KEJ27_09740 [Candidatus Bathyarchaeota archaeon]|nr:hypothetical protein [Candidatus Bathyarchaeota archaeon]
MEFRISEELFKRMIQTIPSIHLMYVLKQFGISIPPEIPLEDRFNYIFTNVDEHTKRRMFEEYGATRAKTSIFLYRPGDALFRNISEICEAVDSLELRKYLGNYYEPERLTRPTLQSVYIDQNHSSLKLFFISLGKTVKIVDREGRVRPYSQAIESVVTFWAENNLVDVRIQGGTGPARRILDEARVILKIDSIPFTPVKFDNPFFIRNALNWVDIVGYITLEFRGVEIGKLSYSAPRKGRVPAEDLKKSRRVREDIEDAFKKGAIRLMNGYIKKKDTEVISFAVNFRQGKIRMLAFSSETDHNFIFSNLVKFLEKEVPELEAHKRRTLLDFTGS